MVIEKSAPCHHHSIRGGCTICIFVVDVDHFISIEAFEQAEVLVCYLFCFNSYLFPAQYSTLLGIRPIHFVGDCIEYHINYLGGNFFE